jgi:predicted XRE-type DNA-binding protein
MAVKKLIAHVSRGNVLDDLGFGSAEAAAVKMKSQLHSEIIRAIERRGYTQADLQDRLNESQPRVSDLMRGKISKFSLETLVGYAERLGLRPRMKTAELAGAGSR